MFPYSLLTKEGLNVWILLYVGSEFGVNVLFVGGIDRG